MTQNSDRLDHDGPSSSASPAAIDIGAAEFLIAAARTLRRRRRLFLLTVAGVIVLAVAFVLLAPERYTSDAALVVHPRQSSVIDAIADLIPEEVRDRELARNHAELVRSRSIAAAVVDELGLEDDPEFASENGGSKTDAGAMARRRERAKVLETFGKRLEVSAKSNSRVIEIEFTASTPEKAYRILDSVVRHYLDRQVARKSRISGSAREWLDARAKRIRAEIDDLDRSIEEFQQKVGFIGEDDASLVTLSLFSLDNSLAQIRSQRAQVAGRIRAVEKAMAASPTEAASAIESPALQSLRDQLVRSRERKSVLAEEHGANDPRVRELELQIGALRAQIDLESKAALQTMRAVADSLRASERALDERRAALEKRLATLNENEWRLAAMLREKEALTDVFEEFEERRSKIEGQEEVVEADAEIISPASFPTRPSFPQKRLILTLAVVVSLFAGAVVVALTDAIDAALQKSPPG